MSKTPSRRQQAEKPRSFARGLVRLAGGMVCVFLGLAVAHYAGLARKLELDFAGDRAIGEAVRLATGNYTLRYEAPSGVIYRKQYRGRFGLRQPEAPSFDVKVAYDPGNPAQFQPAGESYLPGLVSAPLLLAGLGLILRARREMLRGAMRGRTEPEKAEEKSESRGAQT